jgi:hypothetical protein
MMYGQGHDLAFNLNATAAANRSRDSPSDAGDQPLLRLVRQHHRVPIRRSNDESVRADVPETRDTDAGSYILEAAAADDTDQVTALCERGKSFADRRRETYGRSLPPNRRQCAVKICEKRQSICAGKTPCHVGPGVEKMPGRAIR